MAPPTHLTVATFNLLAPCYKRMSPAVVTAAPGTAVGGPGGSAHPYPDRPTASTPWASRPRRPREGDAPHLWRPRLAALIDELASLQPPPDILCLQEWWFASAYADALTAALEGTYVLTTARRPGKDDGLAIGVRRPLGVAAAASWRLVDGDDRVALLVAVEAGPPPPPLPVGIDGGGVGGSATAAAPVVVVVNTHLTFPHGVGDGVMRLQQVSALTEVVDGWVDEAPGREGAPVLIVGDFNGEASDAVAAHLVARDYVNSWEAGVTAGGRVVAW
ncbi:hypothetical protein MMPV_000210 [Pyropia vietnamensis]